MQNLADARVGPNRIGPAFRVQKSLVVGKRGAKFTNNAYYVFAAKVLMTEPSEQPISIGQVAVSAGTTAID